MDNFSPGDFSIDFNSRQEIIQQRSENLQEEIAEAREIEEAKGDTDEDMQEAIEEFVSIFIQQMFSSMRDTIPEGGLLDGGYAEDVFTEMMDEEISEMGAQQSHFKQLNETIFRQLNQ